MTRPYFIQYRWLTARFYAVSDEGIIFVERRQRQTTRTIVPYRMLSIHALVERPAQPKIKSLAIGCFTLACAAAAICTGVPGTRWPVFAVGAVSLATSVAAWLVHRSRSRLILSTDPGNTLYFSYPTNREMVDFKAFLAEAFAARDAMLREVFESLSTRDRTERDAWPLVIGLRREKVIGPDEFVAFVRRSAAYAEDVVA